MPYIPADRRAVLFETYLHKDAEEASFNDCIKNAGELNFVLTKICLEYFHHNGGRYQQYNDIVGALECCKLEMYRRAIIPYEDKKILENGDVYDR